MSIRAVILGLLPLLLGSSLVPGRGGEPSGQEGCEVLFIGNSLTYFNDQPDIVRRLAEAAGRSILVDEATVPGVALDHHAQSSQTRDKIQSRKWTYVVLQQASWEVAFPEYHNDISSPLESLRTTILENDPDTRILYAMDYSAKNGLTWFGRDRSFEEAQQLLRDGTLVLAREMGFSVAPVGWAFNEVVRSRPDMELFSPDQLHPSYLGSYLGAVVYFGVFFRESAEGNPYHGLARDYVAPFLQKVGSEVVMDGMEDWYLSQTDNPCTSQQPG